MGYATCRKCNGSGRFYDRKSGKTFDCRACDGTGSDKRYWTTKCERCRTEITYKANTTTPRFCRDCRNIELTKTCAQPGCNNTIKYRVGWTDVRDYCGSCHNKRQKGFSASTCPGTGVFGCGKVVWSPPGKRYTHCRECNERKRAEEAKKWREKSCPGLKGQSCGKTIRYRTDWDHPPSLCPDCREKAKRAKADRESKMREKTCAGRGCNNTVRYSTDWDHPPSFCRSCNEKRKAFKAQYPNARKFETRDTSYVMPGVSQTIGQMGGTFGKHYFRQGKIHCMVFEGMRGEDLHYSWDVDPVTGEVIGEIYMHPNNPRG
jgi:hypothetical protein